LPTQGQTLPEVLRYEPQFSDAADKKDSLWKASHIKRFMLTFIKILIIILGVDDKVKFIPQIERVQGPVVMSGPKYANVSDQR